MRLFKYDIIEQKEGKHMKYLVVSDIHGALSGAEAILKAKEHHQIKNILCLGDILYHGPRNDLPEDYAPKKVIPIMNGLKNNIICVRGNCEAEVDQMVLEFPCMADYNIVPFDDHKVFMTHGHIYSPNNLPTLLENDCFLSGHTHIPTAKKENDIFLLNPGSISLPKEDHPRTYAVLTDTDFTVYTLEQKEYMHITF